MNSILQNILRIMPNLNQDGKQEIAKELIKRGTYKPHQEI
jgi:hypothetical protein